MTLGEKYILQCRQNTLDGITPSNPGKYKMKEYKDLISIGKSYIDEKSLTEFADFFQGDQYFIELWTAHIIIEYGKPDIKLKEQCIEIIKKYSNNPLDIKVSKEEKEWLKKHSS
ncbi:hypothetical protein DU508_00080 [Pedobacter chinensis]|uniref:Uncharacterized protein n=1 Tax=Pedobacter chinensis TaxID=2282421 RepID=A0A369Q0I3_9SPHI|nr:hypothetical protein [Pedobacter chinensis]RDC58441.1 hypothetical protein DU508_00080 [Pedobacter chinensis]